MPETLRHAVSWLMLLALAPLPAAAEGGRHVRFSAEGEDSFEVSADQGGHSTTCPQPVRAGQSCDLELLPGAATVTAREVFDFETSLESDTQFHLAYRRGWPKWLGLGIVVGGIASLGLGATYQAACGSSNVDDQLHCSSAPAGWILGTVLLLVGLPLMVWGLIFTGNRTTSEPLSTSP
jgi:hypothetical protein